MATGGKLPARNRKIAVLGFRGVGKSTLTIQFVDRQFVDMYHPTVESTFQKTLQFKGRDYITDIVDTAGQDETSIFPANCSVGVHGYVLVYSITSRPSLEIVKTIHDKILDVTGANYVPAVLVGNKTDLHIERRVQTEEGQKLAEEWSCRFLEASARSNANVDDIFISLLDEIEKHMAIDVVEKKSDCALI